MLKIQMEMKQLLSQSLLYIFLPLKTNKQTITNMDSDEVKLDELCMIMGVHNMQEIKLH